MIYNKEIEPRPSETDKNVSEDVITIDECNMLNIGFYHYLDKKWYFHTNTLVDYYEKDNEMDFKWMYKPSELKYE